MIATRKLMAAGRTGMVVAFLLASVVSPVLGAPPTRQAADVDGREQDVPAYAAVGAADPTIGRIEIPRVGVSAPILEGVDYRTIRRAVGHFPETPLPGHNGNMALAAHRTTHFWGLRNIRIGDEITITTTGAAFRYRVDKLWVVDPEDVSVLDSTSSRVLTLVTCFPFDYVGSAPQRFIVRARAVPLVPAAAPAAATDCPPAD